MTNLGSKSRRVYFRPTASYYELAASFTAYSWGESPAIERMQQGGALVCESPGGSPRIGLCNVCMAFNKRSDFSCLLSQQGESQNLIIRMYDKRSEKNSLSLMSSFIAHSQKMYSQMAKECLRNIFKEAKILVPAWRRGINPLARQTSGTLRCSSF